MPIRVQRRRIKGWKKPPNTVNVARGRGVGKYGNPYKIGATHPRHGCPMSAQEAVDLFVENVLPTLDLAPLRGQNLMCYCPLDQPCHGNPLLEKANEQ